MCLWTLLARALPIRSSPAPASTPATSAQPAKQGHDAQDAQRPAAQYDLGDIGFQLSYETFNFGRHGFPSCWIGNSCHGTPSRGSRSSPGSPGVGPDFLATGRRRTGTGSAGACPHSRARVLGKRGQARRCAPSQSPFARQKTRPHTIGGPTGTPPIPSVTMGGLRSLPTRSAQVS